MPDFLSMIESGDLAPLVATAMMMMIPIVAILARHQQKMTMIMRQPANAGHDEAILRLANEVHELRALIAQQAMAMDSLADTNRRLSMSLERPPVSERISV